MPGSSTRSDPAAALRGFANSDSPSFSRSALSRAKGPPIEHYFPANFERYVFFHPERQRPNRPCVLGHILADGPIAPRYRLFENAPCRYRAAIENHVHLQFGHITVLRALQQLPDAAYRTPAVRPL